MHNIKKQRLQEGQGGLSGLSPLRSDSSHDSQVGRLDHVRSGQRQLRGAIGLSPLRSNGSCDGQAGRLDKVTVVTKDTESKLSLKGDYQAQVHWGQMVLMVAKQEGWTA
jgi:hypothetical protein